MKHKHTTQEYKHGVRAFLLIPVIFVSIYIAEYIGLLAGLVALVGATWKLTDWLKQTDPTRKRHTALPQVSPGTYQVLQSGEVRRVES